MQIDDSNLFDWAFKGIVGLCMVVLSWVAGKQVKNIEKNTDDLHDFKNEVAKEYATRDDLKEAMRDFKESLGGVHRRFDEFFNKVNK